MRTADATSPVPGASIAGTLALFVVAYGIVFWFGIYYINRLIAHGPRRAGGRRDRTFRRQSAVGRRKTSDAKRYRE